MSKGQQKHPVLLARAKASKKPPVLLAIEQSQQSLRYC